MPPAIKNKLDTSEITIGSSVGRLLPALAFLFLTGCSIVDYHSHGRIPIYLGDYKLKAPMGALKDFSVNVGKDFYFWGMYPARQIVHLDSELDKNGIFTVYDLNIYEYRSLGDVLISIVTFGMYMPQTHRISGTGVYRHVR